MYLHAKLTILRKQFRIVEQISRVKIDGSRMNIYAEINSFIYDP